MVPRVEAGRRMGFRFLVAIAYASMAGLTVCVGDVPQTDETRKALSEDNSTPSTPPSPSSPGGPILAGETSTGPFGIPGWRQIMEPSFGGLDEMVERRIIRAAVAHSRTLFFLDGGQQRGLTYEALYRFEEFLNESLGTGMLQVHVVTVPLPRDELLPALVDGRVDLAAANLTVTRRRLEMVDFSDPLLRNVSELLITGPATPSPESLNDLSDFEVHVRRSSSYYQSLLELNARFEREGRRPVRIQEADEFLEDEDLIELVNAGIIPSTVVDNLKAEVWSLVFENITVHPHIALREGGSVAWAIRKGSPNLHAMLNRFAEEHRQGTLYGNVVLRRYLGSAEYIANPLDPEGEEHLEAVLPVFQKFASQYGLDPALLLAQAYQESALDHEATSSAGAVGIMQLMPSTAADPNVGIPDISGLEDNVNAGAKYLRFLLDRYFSDGELDPLNEHLFALAAYNAGASSVTRLRSEAAEMGLDPNRWFQNVEVVAARRLGRETVQYVSNIFKYYLTYSRIEHLNFSHRPGSSR